VTNAHPREGKQGVPLVLNMTVVDSATCEPLSDAAVEVVLPLSQVLLLFFL
jgi:protocatechuate 3,4-dioxygenase beta subunit